jgi:hypothetical protein
MRTSTKIDGKWCIERRRRPAFLGERADARKPGRLGEQADEVGGSEAKNNSHFVILANAPRPTVYLRSVCVRFDIMYPNV